MENMQRVCLRWKLYSSADHTRNFTCKLSDDCSQAASLDATCIWWKCGVKLGVVFKAVTVTQSVLSVNRLRLDSGGDLTVWAEQCVKNDWGVCNTHQQHACRQLITLFPEIMASILPLSSLAALMVLILQAPNKKWKLHSWKWRKWMDGHHRVPIRAEVSISSISQLSIAPEKTNFPPPPLQAASLSKWIPAKAAVTSSASLPSRSTQTKELNKGFVSTVIIYFPSIRIESLCSLMQIWGTTTQCNMRNMCTRLDYW